MTTKQTSRWRRCAAFAIALMGWGGALHVPLVPMAPMSTAEAHYEGVTLRVVPYPQAESAVSPYLYVLEITASEDATEIVADRRLLTLRSSDSGFTCRHPNRPSVTADHRIRELNAGETWQEWIDLRMYCGAADRGRLREGASFAVSYGYSRGSPYRWVVDPPERGEHLVGSLTGAPLVIPPMNQSPNAESAHHDGDRHDEQIRIGMLPADVSSNDVLGFRVWVRGNRDRRQRIYIRPDMWRFVVTGPTGRTTCAIPDYHPGPVADFYRNVSRHLVHRAALDGDGFCRDAFHVAGVYQVTPVLDLRYDGSEHERPSVVGTFVGAPAAVRVRRGTIDRYFPHLLPD